MCIECEEAVEATQACKFTGADIDCLGIKTGDTLESAITKMGERVCNLDEAQSLSSSIVKYTETALGNSFSRNVLFSIPTTAYTVPLGEDGEYEIEYVGEAQTGAGAGTLALYVYKNTSEYSATVRRTVSLAAGSQIVPFVVKASKIALVAGDVLKIVGFATTNIYPQNAVCKITKIS